MFAPGFSVVELMSHSDGQMPVTVGTRVREERRALPRQGSGCGGKAPVRVYAECLVIVKVIVRVYPRKMQTN